MAAESQSILIAAIIPIFVAVLALAAFMNGFWMVYFTKLTFFNEADTPHRFSVYKATLSEQHLCHDFGIIGRIGLYVFNSDFVEALLNVLMKDFQTFAFQLLVRNDVKGLIFECPTVKGSCLCPFSSSLVPSQCALTGDDLVKVGTASIPW